MLFLSDLSRQKCTKYTGQQEFDVPDSPTEKRERIVANNKHIWTQATRCVGHEIALQTEYAESNNESSHCFQSAPFSQDLSHCSECADNQKKRLVVGTNNYLALLRVRGEGQRNTTREVTRDEDRHKYRTTHVRGMTSTPQCAMQRRMERYDGGDVSKRNLMEFTIASNEIQYIVIRNPKLAGPRRSASRWTSWHRNTIPAAHPLRSTRDMRNTGKPH